MEIVKLVGRFIGVVKPKKRGQMFFGKLLKGIKKGVDVGASIATNPMAIGLATAFLPPAGAAAGLLMIAEKVATLVKGAEAHFADAKEKKGPEKLALVTNGFLDFIDMFNVVAPDGYEADVDRDELKKLIDMSAAYYTQAEVVRKSIKFVKVDPQAADFKLPQ